MIGFTPRPYQDPRIDEAADRLLSGGNPSIVMATGTGKTKTALATIDKVLSRSRRRAGSALWVVDRKPLVRQTERAAAKHRVPVHVRTIQGVRHIDPRDYDMIVVDEAHNFLTPKRKAKIQEAKTPMLALTATPRTGDGRHIESVFDPPVCGPYTLGQAITDGYLCDCLIKRVELRSLDLREVRMGKRDSDGYRDFVKSDLAKVMNDPDVNREVIERVLEYARLDDGTLALTNLFGVDTDHADDLAAEFNKQARGALAHAIHSNIPNADELLDSFLAAAFRVASSVMMIAEGFDYPALRIAAQARPCKSVRLLVQQLGRLLRLHKSKAQRLMLQKLGLLPDAEPGRQFAVLLDFDGAYETLDLARIYDAVEPQRQRARTVSGDRPIYDDDAIPMLSEIVSLVRDVDLLARACAEARTLPWHYVNREYAFRSGASDVKVVVGYAVRIGPREVLAVGPSRRDGARAAVVRFYRDGGYAKFETIEKASPEASAFRQAEAWAMSRRLLADWPSAPIKDTKKLIDDWFRDVGPPSPRLAEKLSELDVTVPPQHGLAVKEMKRLYARGEVRQAAG